MADKTTIYVISPGGTRARGGMGRMLRYFVNEIRRRPDTPEIVILDTYGPGNKLLMPVYFAVSLLRLLAACILGKVDVLHVHVSERGSVLRKFVISAPAVIVGIPVVMHMHGAGFVEFYRSLPSALQRLVSGFLRKCRRVVVLGSFWQAYVVNELRLDPARVVVLHNAVPAPSRPAPLQAPKTDLVPGADCRLIFVGEVGPRKGVPELLEALALSPLQASSWSLKIAGNGAVRQFEALAETKNLKSPRVTFLGWTDEETTRRLLAESDVLILPSHNEGLPMAILEALSYGLAVVTTPVGSIADAIEDGRNGLLVPPGDPAKLSEAIFTLVSDRALRERLGRNARDTFEKNFEIGPYCDRLLALYSELSTRRPHAFNPQ